MRERDLRTMDLSDPDLAEQLRTAEKDAETRYFGERAELVDIEIDEDDAAWRDSLVRPLRKISYRDDPADYASPLRLAVVGDSAAWTN